MIYQRTKRKKEKTKKRKHLIKTSSPNSQPLFETSIASIERKVKLFCAVQNPAMSGMTKLIFVHLFGTESSLAKAKKGQLVSKFEDFFGGYVS